ncbi:MAG: hypothetical protein KatS3mg110_4203 [Pirellulaceae bacterium]|nr:MAG: hypothetical protein KatS3mg110_4203 [Pirellulaceae bacterium]
MAGSRLALRAVAMCVAVLVSLPAVVAQEAGMVLKEFVFTVAPFPECHASTLLETPEGLLAAWFGGTREGHPDVRIWLARRGPQGWTAPEPVADGAQPDGTRFPCWNPVLTRTPGGEVWLFYKVGPRPSSWWGMWRRSSDNGKNWSEPVRLPDGILGPIKNKPIWLAGGRMLSGSSTEHDGWRVHMEWTENLGSDWHKTQVLNPGDAPEAIQPAILVHSPEVLQILCRARRAGRILEAWSQDGGRHWSDLAPTVLPNPNSGIDAVTLADGTHVLVYNPTIRGRSPLDAAISADGRQWRRVARLESEPGEFSYPAVIQTSDGLVHVSYTWKRQRIAHVVLDPQKWQPGEILGEP